MVERCEVERVMKIHNKIFLIGFAVVILTIITVVCMISPLLGSGFGTWRPGYHKVERFIGKYTDELTKVCSFLNECKYDYIRWDSYEPDRLEYSSDESSNSVTVEDSDLIGALNTLKQNGIESIVKVSECISFTMWSSLDSSCGLVYCADDEPKLEYNYGKITYRKYKEKNWFYYRTIGD